MNLKDQFLRCLCAITVAVENNYFLAKTQPIILRFEGKMSQNGPLSRGTYSRDPADFSPGNWMAEMRNFPGIPYPGYPGKKPYVYPSKDR